MTYCVYEHWRPDTNSCFYVGKGKARRAKSFEPRNDRHGKIVAKLRRNGLEPILVIVADGLTGDEAIRAEIERIKLRRSQGLDIANYTDGGDGTPGYVQTAETRAKIAAKATGRKMSPETLAKVVAFQTGSKRSDETRARQSAAAKVSQKLRFERMKASEEGRLALDVKMAGMRAKQRRFAKA